MVESTTSDANPVRAEPFDHAQDRPVEGRGGSLSERASTSSARTAPLLSVSDLQVHYGGIAAVKGISFDIAAGEVVCLIGANGAGKTSTLKALARLLPSSGAIRYGQESITALPAHGLVSRGLVLVPEGRGVFARLSVEENLDMGAYHRQGADTKSDLQRIYDLLPRLKERRKQLAGTLSGGEQQMLAIGRALMGQPKLLLLDEPSMGLAPIMVQKIFEIVSGIAAAGVTILLVEQNAHLALKVCSRGYVMESGKIAITGSSAELSEDPRVRAAYLGE